jgi:hypothetical protein
VDLALLCELKVAILGLVFEPTRIWSSSETRTVPPRTVVPYVAVSSWSGVRMSIAPPGTLMFAASSSKAAVRAAPSSGVDSTTGCAVGVSAGDAEGEPASAVHAVRTTAIDSAARALTGTGARRRRTLTMSAPVFVADPRAASQTGRRPSIMRAA